MVTAASLAGIEDNGLRWRKKLKIRHVLPTEEITDEQVPDLITKIKETLSKYEFLPDTYLEELDYVDDAEEMIMYLDWLYDWADYERVLFV